MPKILKVSDLMRQHFPLSFSCTFLEQQLDSRDLFCRENRAREKPRHRSSRARVILNFKVSREQSGKTRSRMRPFDNYALLLAASEHNDLRKLHLRDTVREDRRDVSRIRNVSLAHVQQHVLSLRTRCSRYERIIFANDVSVRATQNRRMAEDGETSSARFPLFAIDRI